MLTKQIRFEKTVDGLHCGMQSILIVAMGLNNYSIGKILNIFRNIRKQTTLTDKTCSRGGEKAKITAIQARNKKQLYECINYKNGYLGYLLKHSTNTK